MNKPRKDHEPPAATGEWGWRFHHIGIPTRQPILGETYLPAFRLGVGGFDTSPFGIEWMRYEEDSPVDELIQTVPHIAFEVDDLDLELERHSFHILTPPNAPSSGVRVAMIEHNGAPVELDAYEAIVSRVKINTDLIGDGFVPGAKSQVSLMFNGAKRAFSATVTPDNGIVLTLRK